MRHRRAKQGGKSKTRRRPEVERERRARPVTRRRDTRKKQREDRKAGPTPIQSTVDSHGADDDAKRKTTPKMAVRLFSRRYRRPPPHLVQLDGRAPFPL